MSFCTFVLDLAVGWWTAGKQDDTLSREETKLTAIMHGNLTHDVM